MLGTRHRRLIVGQTHPELPGVVDLVVGADGEAPGIVESRIERLGSAAGQRPRRTDDVDLGNGTPACPGDVRQQLPLLVQLVRRAQDEGIGHLDAGRGI